MLTKTYLLESIKTRLGHPHFGIEIPDEKIWAEVVNKAIPLFSKYVPHTAFKHLTAADRDPNIPTLYYLNNEDGVISVKNVLLPQSIAFVTGHPWLFVPNYDNIPEYIIQIDKARTTERYSVFNISWEFIPPNKLYIYPSRVSNFTFLVRYEKNHPKDLSTIPTRFITDFIELTLAIVKEMIADYRSKYQTISTPFGEINLNVDAMKSEAIETRDKILERLSQLPPNTIVEIA